MSEAEQSVPRQEVKSDEAWKDRVKAEDAKLDAERSPAREPETSPSESAARPVEPSELPKPQFATLVGLFSTQAMVSLGLIGHPEDGSVEVQLPLARHFIDLLGVVEEKTRGNLSEAEDKMLEQTLHDLRMAYVERSRTQE